MNAVLSNFGVIFCPDPIAATKEMVRVLAPEGRIVFTARLPGGAIGQMNQAAEEMVRAALGAPSPRHPSPGTTPRRSRRSSRPTT